MFTGIIETIGTITELLYTETNKTFWVTSPLSNELKVDQSLAHDGVCLTVEEVKDNRHRVTAVLETLEKTNLQDWKPGKNINLERCLSFNGKIEGHLVQGHIDTAGILTNIKEQKGSKHFIISFPKQFANLVIEKGSIAINGISLTAFNVGSQSFEVAIIPYTYEHTAIKHLKTGDKVNLEFDLIGKYLSHFQQVRDFQ
ncbi:MAG TPA: riboflavin synthase [Chitinophagaceae bacterium]|nr:riboflavin synthase [Chitinophagaceae bacterium]